MTRMMIVSALLAAVTAAVGCGGSEKTNTVTVPASAHSKIPLAKVEPVRGKDYEAQALEGSIARFVQWGNLHYGRTVLDTRANNTCEEQVEDLWYCYVTINVVKPIGNFKRGPLAGAYTVTRDTKRNQMVYITGTS